MCIIQESKKILHEKSEYCTVPITVVTICVEQMC
jgi:hypothetical protein